MQKSFKVKAVIFDRDGVIINTEGLLIASVRIAFKQLGFELQDEDIPHLIGRSYLAYKQYFLDKWDFDFDEYRKIQFNYFHTNLDLAPFFEDAIELAKSLHNKKIPIAMTTSAGKENTLLILKKGSIDQLFDVIITREDCNNLKPDPEPYLTTAKKLGIDPKFCLAIEDTALGVESAKKAGMWCIAIPNEYTNNQNFLMADAVVQSAKEVEKLLEFVK